jgi:manganese oxidase
MSSYDIDPGSSLPKVMTMTDFDLWAWNTRVFPGIDPLAVRRGDRVRVRIGNLTMTNHPIHLHGHEFEVTCTDGGWVPASARLPEVTTDVPVGAMRAFEFVADEPGDWAIHCHKSHHTMNAMGHEVKTLIGARASDLRKSIAKAVPDYMAMGGNGMAEMGRMRMPLPDNTLPMMTGFGQFGPLEMGGMFSVVKVREGIAAGDYGDPGPYRHPQGTVAYEYQGPVDAPARRSELSPAGRPAVEVKVIKPGSKTKSMSDH